MTRGRLVRATAVASWAAFFAVIWVVGDADRYLGARTTWVVPFGAVVTTLAVVALLLDRGALDRPLRRPEAIGILALLSPILAVIAVPHAELGAAAAERRAADPATAARLVAAHPGPISELGYPHIMAAAVSPQPGVEAGVRVRLVGFAMRRHGTPVGMFQVARFAITCCIADATAVWVTVKPPNGVPPRNAWVTVTGPLARRPGEWYVRAQTVERIPPPAKPYLSQWGEIALPSKTHGTTPPDPTK